MPNYYVYIIRCKNNKYYTGYTIDIESRIEKHRSGLGSKFMRFFGFSKLLYSESYSTKSEALKREAQIKSWSRVEKEALINSGLNKINELSKG